MLEILETEPGPESNCTVWLLHALLAMVDNRFVNIWSAEWLNDVQALGVSESKSTLSETNTPQFISLKAKVLDGGLDDKNTS